MKTKNTGRKFLSKKVVCLIDEIKRSVKFLALSSLLFTVSGIFSACKKNNDKKTSCNIIAASIPSLGIGFNFSYNSDCRINRITAGLVVTSFDYPAANTVIVTTLNAGSFQSKKIINVNAAGLATNVRVENNVAGTDFTNDSFEYNGEELIRSVSTSSFDPNSRITTYTWFNGNMVTVTSGAAIIESREYFADKPRQAGDIFSFNQLTQGFETIRTKNLVKFTSLSAGLFFTYEFSGPEGNISSVQTSFSGGGGGFQDYQYECK